MSNRRAFWCWVGLLVVASAVGCARQPQQTYVPRAELKELPDKQRQEIVEFLEKYYGTPANPKLMAPAADSAEGEVKLVDQLADTHRRDPLHLKHGAQVYARQCAPCHGVTGDGQGVAAQYLNPPPRDYRLGRFKFASTPRGYKPRRIDLTRIIRYGAKGTSMPSFRWLPKEDVDAVLDYVIVLSSRGELELALLRDARDELDEGASFPPPLVAANVTRIAASWRDAETQKVMPLTVTTVASEEAVRAGAKAFVELNCFKCHGKDGKGNKAFDVGKDDWGRVAYAADLTTGTLHGGRRPVDIYRRIYSGINGTPMPAFSQPDTNKNETPEQRSETIWNLVHFVTSIVEGKPLPMDLIDETIKTLPAPTTEAKPAE